MAGTVQSCPTGCPGKPMTNLSGPGAWDKGQTVVSSRPQKGSMALELSLPFPEPQFPLLKSMRDALLGQGTSELQHACRLTTFLVLVATLSVQTIFLRSYYIQAMCHVKG